MNTFKEDQNYLKQAIESYLNQNHVEVQLIISTVENDTNIPFILSNYPNVEIAILPKDQHPGKSPKASFIQLNNALPLIRGEWFCFASSNDYAQPDKLISEIHACRYNNKEVCYSAFTLVDENGEFISVRKFHPYSFNKHLQGNFVSDCALISKRLVDQYLPFNVDLNNYAYWDLWLRIFEGEGDVFTYKDLPTWNYRQDSNSMHIKRRSNKQQQLKADQDRERMLSIHK